MDDDKDKELEIIFTPENEEDYMLPVCLDNGNCLKDEFPCAWCLYVPLDASLEDIAKYLAEMRDKKTLKN